jgi:hypothetical protein
MFWFVIVSVWLTVTARAIPLRARRVANEYMARSVREKKESVYKRKTMKTRI